MKGSDDGDGQGRGHHAVSPSSSTLQQKHTGGVANSCTCKAPTQPQAASTAPARGCCMPLTFVAQSTRGGVIVAAARLGCRRPPIPQAAASLPP